MTDYLLVPNDPAAETFAISNEEELRYWRSWSAERQRRGGTALNAVDFAANRCLAEDICLTRSGCRSALVLTMPLRGPLKAMANNQRLDLGSTEEPVAEIIRAYSGTLPNSDPDLHVNAYPQHRQQGRRSCRIFVWRHAG